MFLFVFLFSVSFSSSLSCSNNGSTILKSGFSKEETNLILKLHNELRANVALGNVEFQEKAKNMKKLRWDEELAKLAQNWSNNCVYDHDYGMKDPKGRFNIGQNIGITEHTLIDDENPDFNFIFDLWADEKENFNYSRITESDTLRTGRNQTLHYTQIVAAKTYLIGCGYTLYIKEDFYPYGKFYVCNYGPIGNIELEYPYERRDEYEPLCDNEVEDSEIDGLCERKGLNESFILQLASPENKEIENITEENNSTAIEENENNLEMGLNDETNSTIIQIEQIYKEDDFNENSQIHDNKK